MAPALRYHCPHCCRGFKAQGHLASHIRRSEYCRKWDELATPEGSMPPLIFDDFDDTSPDPPSEDEIGHDEDAIKEILDNFYAATGRAAREPTPAPPSEDPPPHVRHVTSPPKHTSNDNIDVFTTAGKVLQQDSSINDRWMKRHGHLDNPYYPFKSKLDWEIGRWAKEEGPGASAVDRLLKSEAVRDD